MPEEINNANQLCTACGMCCDGTLFQYAIVKYEEKEKVLATGLTVNDINGELSFNQPCKYFCQNQCAIYMQRPPVCTSYRCRLLKKLNLGEVSLENALAKVKMVRALQVGLMNILPKAKTNPISAREVIEIRGAIDEAEPLQRKQHAVFLMLSTKYIGLIRDDFWRKPKPAKVLESIDTETQEKLQVKIIADSYKIK